MKRAVNQNEVLLAGFFVVVLSFFRLLLLVIVIASHDNFLRLKKKLSYVFHTIGYLCPNPGTSLPRDR